MTDLHEDEQNGTGGDWDTPLFDDVVAQYWDPRQT